MNTGICGISTTTASAGFLPSTVLHPKNNLQGGILQLSAGICFQGVTVEIVEGNHVINIHVCIPYLCVLRFDVDGAIWWRLWIMHSWWTWSKCKLLYRTATILSWGHAPNSLFTFTDFFFLKLSRDLQTHGPSQRFPITGWVTTPYDNAVDPP